MENLIGSIPQKAHVDISSLNDLHCVGCNGRVFGEGLIIKPVSSLLTGTGKEGMIPIPAFYCINCGLSVDRYLPEELREKTLVK